ncbi:MAG: GNAT family N-acetyltransferase [Lactobacillales bacterium]|jgi:GNAT superfamily N-acetyltransferase|nr:GNAT family N-acetyltransferase [Lactobacillales bacterium]
MNKIEIVPYDKLRPEAMEWYSNPGIQKNVNGIEMPYSREQIQKMYDYQRTHGELYYIEYNGKTVGDASTFDDEYAIVVAPEAQGKGIGSIVTEYFVSLARLRGDKEFKVEIHDYNEPSKKMFARLGFENSEGNSYKKLLV